MRAKSVLLLVLALGCGLIASIGISQVMDRRAPAPVEEVEKVQVFVAKVDIPKAELIKPDMVKIQQWPKDMVPDDAITKLDQIENKQAHEKILANELIREARFIKADKKIHIPPGYRVVTVKVNAEKGGHLVSVGDKVDLQVYIRQGAAAVITESITRTFLRDVKVFAVGTETTKQNEEIGNSAQTVSLLVRPKEAELVTLAQRTGEVSIVMKNASDTSVAQNEQNGVRLSDLLREIGIDVPGETKPSSFTSKIVDQLKPAKLPARKAHTFTMLVYNGPEVVQYSFDDPTKGPIAMATGTNRPNDGPQSLGPPQPDSEPQDGDTAPEKESTKQPPPKSDADKLLEADPTKPL
jgi:pilus assembly protein CpaB